MPDYAKTGIPVSIGVGATKTIAKAASVVAKKRNGVFIFNTESWKTYAETMSCGMVWGVGRGTSARLTTLGIKTVASLLALDCSFLNNTFVVVGERLYLELSGIPVSCEKSAHREQGNITSTRTFKTVVSRTFSTRKCGELPCRGGERKITNTQTGRLNYIDYV